METRPNTNFVDILRVVFKRKALILWFFFATVGTVTAVAALLHKPMYKASAQILLQVGREHVSDLSLPTGGAVRPVVSFNQDEQITLAIEILKGHHLARQVLSAVGHDRIYPKPEESYVDKFRDLLIPDGPDAGPNHEVATLQLQDDITIVPIGKSPLLNVSFRHEDPKTSAEVVNTLVRLYLARHLNIRKNPQVDAFFQDQFVALESKLKKSEEELGQFKKRHGITSSVTEGRTILLKQQMKLEAELSETEIRQADIGKRIEQLRHQLADTSKDPKTISTIRDKLVALQIKEEELLINYAEGSRHVQNVRDEIRPLKEKLARLGANKRYGNTSSGEGSLYQRLQEEILRQEVELKALNAKRAAQQSRVVDYGAQLARLERLEVEFNGLQERIRLDRDNYHLYLTKFEESRISDAMDEEKIASVKIVEPAFAPINPVESKARLAVLLSVVLGGVGGIGWGFLAELLGGSIDTRKDVECLLDAPVLAAIPELPIR